MSNREDYNSTRENADLQFLLSNNKSRIGTTTGKNSSNHNKAKHSKIFFDKKQNENNERAQIKTPTSQASRTRKGVTVN
jgi:hypothetical protein